MKGFIYVIRSNQTTNVYYGSTKQPINDRLHRHRSEYRGYLKGNRPYGTSFEIIQYDDAFIELVETVEYEDKKELHKQEGIYIQNHECVNKSIPGRTQKEWGKEYYKQNKEHSLLKMKEYREKNRDKIREQKRIAYLKKKEDLL